MYYHRRIGLVALVLLLAGSRGYLQAQDDGWQVTDSAGQVLAPVRSLPEHPDSVAAILLTTRVTQWGDSAVVHRFLEPRMVPLSSLRELRYARADGAALGIVVGLVAGGLVALMNAFSETSGTADIVVPLVAGPMIGGVTGVILGTDDIYDLDPLTPSERRALILANLPRATAGELGIRTLDSVVVSGQRDLEYARKGKRWKPWEIAVGAGPGVWLGQQEGSSLLIPRLTIGIESFDLIFTANYVGSSTRWSNRMVVDLLLGKHLLQGDIDVSVSGGPAFVDATPRGGVPGRPDRDELSGTLGSALGVSLVSEAAFIFSESWGISATGYSTLSTKGTLFGVALSAKLGSFR